MTNELTLDDLKIISNAVGNNIQHIMDSYVGVNYHQSIIDPDYVIKMINRDNKEIFDVQEKLYKLINTIKKDAASDKELNSIVTIKPATSRFQVNVKYFSNHQDINEFLNNKNVEFVDLKVDNYNYHLLYRTIEIDA